MVTITNLNIDPGELGDQWAINVFIPKADDASEPVIIYAEEDYRRQGIESIIVTADADDEWFQILNGSTVMIGPCTLAKGVPWSYRFGRTIRGTVSNPLRLQTETDFDINCIIEGVTDIYPEPASNPNPADSATGVSIGTNLTWDSVPQAVSHNIYFGADSNAVLGATPASPEYKANQAVRSYVPDTLAGATTYYWRIRDFKMYMTAQS